MARALNVDLAELFPRIKKLVKKGDDLGAKLIHLEDDAQRELHNDGLDTDYLFSFVTFGFRSGAQVFFAISGAESKRLRRFTGRIDPESPFFVFTSHRWDVAVNLLHVSVLEYWFETTEENGRSVDKVVNEDDLTIFLGHSTTPLNIEVDPDEGDPDDFDNDEGQIRTILFVAPAGFEETEFLRIMDSSGEETHIRASDLVLMAIPEVVICPAMDDAEGDAPLSLVE